MALDLYSKGTTDTLLAAKAPLDSPTFTGNVTAGGNLVSTAASDDEGGEIQLAIPTVNTTLAGVISIDVYQNKVRFFENGGTNRGAYIDITACADAVGTNILAGGGGGAVWGGITGTLSDQTDLNSALSAKLDSSTAASTYQPKSALNSITSGSTYNVVTSDAGGVVYLDPALSGGLTTVYLPDGTTGNDVANGQSIRFINRSGAFTPVAFATYGSGFPTIYGPGATSGVADGFSVVATKISGYDWFIE